MQPTGQSYDDIAKKRPIQDVLAVSATPSFSCHKEVVPVHDHGPVIPRRRRPRFLTSILIFAFIVFSLISIFPRSLPSWSYSQLMPCLSGDAIGDHDEMTFSGPISPTFSSNGRTDQVQWDSYTLVLQGQRILI